MLSLDRLTADEVRPLHTLVFDLDDTFLDRGALTEAAYAALHRLLETGFKLIVCTGRPAGWAEIVLRQWPLTAAIAENGAVAWLRRADRHISFWDPQAELRSTQRDRLRTLADAMQREHPELVLADDNRARVSDLTFDIGEHRAVDALVVERARAYAHRSGARTTVSSIHLHVTFDVADKASGYSALASAAHAPLASSATAGEPFAGCAYVGDSANDAPAFAAFPLTFGVANVASQLACLSVPPRYVAQRERGAGFAEIAAALVALKTRA